MATQSRPRNCEPDQSGRSETAERLPVFRHEAFSPHNDATRTNERATGEFASAIAAAELRHSTLEPWLDSLASVVGPKRALWADARGCYATSSNPGLS